jgi:hypothetical protein
VLGGFGDKVAPPDSTKQDRRRTARRSTFCYLGGTSSRRTGATLSMWVKSIAASVVSGSVEPGIQLQVTFGRTIPEALLLSAVASLKTAKDQKLGDSAPGYIAHGPLIEVTLPVQKPVAGPLDAPSDLYFQFQFRLTQREVAHIETLRNENAKRNVSLKVEFRATTLRALPRAYPIVYDSLGPPNPRTPSHSFIRQANNEEAVLAPRDHMIILDSARGFLTATMETFHGAVEIPSSDWVHDFAPHLGLGNYLVFELPQPEEVNGEGSIFDRLRRSLVAIQDMKSDVRDGEWTQTIEHSRAVWDLLRDEAVTKPALVSGGLSDEAATALITGMKEMFTFASKFLKPIDAKTRELNPPMKAEKEDAYLVLSSAVSLTNLVARKLRKAVLPPKSP